MLKKIMIFIIPGLILTQTGSASGSAGQAGLLGGAAGGAILGQAIGRDTEGTLLGTAIGGVLGYIVGNEMDKGGRPAPSAVYSRVTPEAYPVPRYREPRYAEEPLCRPAEILATIDGRPERVLTTACLEDGEWVVQEGPGRGLARTVVIERDTIYQTAAPDHFHGYRAEHRPGHGRFKHRRPYRHAEPYATNYEIVIY